MSRARKQEPKSKVQADYSEDVQELGEMVDLEMRPLIAQSAEISEALTHSLPEEYYLAFSDEELKIIYDWAKSGKSGEEYFDSEALTSKVYLMFDQKAITIHEHFLFKNSLMDRANFIREATRLYEYEADKVQDKLKILVMIQNERRAIDQQQERFRKFLQEQSAEADSHMQNIVRRVARGIQKEK
jgi:hypothetical protein